MGELGAGFGCCVWVLDVVCWMVDVGIREGVFDGWIGEWAV